MFMSKQDRLAANYAMIRLVAGYNDSINNNYCRRPPNKRRVIVSGLLTTRKAAWYILSVVAVCLSDDNFRKP